MATEAQFKANRENAQHSTGPRTQAGRATSSQNRLVYGLYTREDYVSPASRAYYDAFTQNLYNELMPVGFLEESLASEIVSATWRLKLCSSAEGQLNWEDFNDASDKARRSIERARAAAQLVINRALTQLKKLQKGRDPMEGTEQEMQNMEEEIAQSLANMMAHPGPPWEELFGEAEPSLASNCKTPAGTPATAPGGPLNKAA